MWGMNPSLLREKLQNCEIRADFGSAFQGWDFWQDSVSASPTCLSVVLLSFVVEEMFS